jgi:tetratricopeptide (TPR) repeat protein
VAWAEGVAARERALAKARVAVGVVLALLSFHQLRYWYASEPLYLRATQISPRDVAMQYNLGNAYLARKHYAAAIGAYQAALAVDPKLVPAHVNLGIAYQEIEMIPNAIAELERAIQLHPRDAAAQLALGNSFLRDGRIDEAIARYERALELEPGAPLVLRALDVARARLAGAAEP